MGRRIALLAVLGVFLGAIGLVGMLRTTTVDDVSAAGILQQGSPLATPVPDSVDDAIAGLPADIEVELLASAEQSGMPANGLVLRLERITFAAGEELSAEATGTELIAIDGGSMAIESGGSTIALETGGQHQVELGTRYVLRTGDDGAVVLRLRLGLESAPVVADATPQGSPVAGPVPVLLFEGNADRLVSRRGTMFLARVTLPPDGTTGEQIFSGPVGVAVETGSIDVSGKQVSALSVEEGHSAFLPGYKAFTASNPGGEAAEVLVGGLLAPPRGGADAPSATPTPAVDEMATSQALIDDLSNNVAALTEQQVSLEETVSAQQTALADAESAQATADAALTAAAVDAQVGAATAESDLQQMQAELAVAQTQIAETNAARETAEAELTVVSNELATSQAAATTAAENASAAESANANEVSALEATVVALQTGVAEGAAQQAAAESTIESLETSGVEQSTALDDANATIAAQLTAQANLVNEQATTESRQATTEADAAAAATAAAEEQAAAQATADAQVSAIAQANATVESQGSAIAEGNTAATTQAQSAEASATAAEAEIAAAEGTSQANAAALAQAQADAAASATAQAETANAAAATASAEASAAAATAAAQSEEIAGLQASLANSVGDLADANATIVALTTEVAESENVAGASVDPAFVDVSIQVDLDQVLAGNETAIQAAQSALEAALQPYASCRAAIVLTFGHGNTIGQGTQLASAINSLIQAEESEIFSGAAFDAYGDLSAPLGQVDLRIYFFTGCEPEPAEVVTPAA